ncbi:hypothetical protein [Amphritea sp. HPY]|uniref:hypothetical protein n=1 Tax=Amphritea sp. HPY TaxID=3421652 RepID=UPI003D7D2397
MKALRRRSLPKPPPARETHDSICKQTDLFLKQGGTVTVVPAGRTGIDPVRGYKPLHKRRF